MLRLDSGAKIVHSILELTGNVGLIWEGMMGCRSDQYVRSIGGNLVSSVIADTPAMRFELLTRRRSSHEVYWHFRQPELALFFFTERSRLNATVDGRSVELASGNVSRFAIIPAATEIEGLWDFCKKDFDYMVMFLKPGFITERLGNQITNCKMMFAHSGLQRAFFELRQEAASPDSVFDLIADSWAMQALAHVSRISNAEPAKPAPLGGLSHKCVRRIEDYIRANLDQPIAVADLASIVGLSSRHFLRAFHKGVGETPYQYVMKCRIDEAKNRLLNTSESITEIALATGFGEAQHFSNGFKRLTGLTPSSFRSRSLS